ncbi:uncharacterized protein AB675_2781 [Cyphellophora attinorum]|uniref:RING-type domain-containing protein n=1 Tax=Cyphellophora attinorum TaxID=1664694 RepID=A0A0N0NRS8_9EURO|nr:uncharacterized protein AB675_2781 [Phialophora attinorum]KPI45179.1 hypothetical protein AB675_2781 [Phialophora attinorum]
MLFYATISSMAAVLLEAILSVSQLFSSMVFTTGFFIGIAVAVASGALLFKLQRPADAALDEQQPLEQAPEQDEEQQPVPPAPNPLQPNIFAPESHVLPTFDILNIIWRLDGKVDMELVPAYPDTEEEAQSVWFRDLEREDVTCVVCWDFFRLFDDDEPNAVMRLPSCRHMFHEECCTEGWNRVMSCPRCTKKYVWMPAEEGEMMGRLLEQA